ncbi:hypothetical protein [Sanguibacter sp. Z1732]|uniref:hypothetical protein n=1 Tax=Sanguibacter sp. Z1732 TaxID=3435412 RepID=UPI003D9C852E
MRFGRGKKTRLPAEMAGLVRGEVLAAAQLRGGGWLVLTPAAVVVIGTGSGDFERAWHTVDRGEWSSDGNRIQLTWVDGHEPVELQLVHDDRELADICAARWRPPSCTPRSSGYQVEERCAARSVVTRKGSCSPRSASAVGCTAVRTWTNGSGRWRAGCALKWVCPNSRG